MIEKVYWVLELAIHRGRFEDLQTLVAAMVEATQRNEVGALNYEWAITDDRQICYQDSDAALTHLESFGANFAARFTEVVKPTRIIVYATPRIIGASRRRCRRLMPGFLLQYAKGISGHRTSEPCFQCNRSLTIISNICWYIHENFRRTGPMELIECLSLLFGNADINQVQFLGFNLHAVEINSVGDRRDYEKQGDNELFHWPNRTKQCLRLQRTTTSPLGLPVC